MLLINIENHAGRFGIVGLVMTILLLVGTITPVLSQERGIENKIPEGANRIIMEQEEVPPADVYVDAVKFLQRKEFDILTSEETFEVESLEGLLEAGPLSFTARKQVNEDMAIRIMADVNTVPGGARLVASVRYADSAEADIGEWKQAKWTAPEAKDAFFKGLEILRGIRYDAMDFEIGVAITTD